MPGTRPGMTKSGTIAVTPRLQHQFAAVRMSPSFASTGSSDRDRAGGGQDFADMAGIELALIGKKTDLYQFRNELRWNDVYFQVNR